jgi:uncharacterized protein YukE
MAELRDSNLNKALAEFAGVRAALRFLHVLDTGRRDEVVTILSWLDWDETKPWDSANHVGRGAKSGVGEMAAAVDDLSNACNALTAAWKGAAADVFQDYAKNVFENCRRIVDELQAMVKVMAAEDGTTHQAMTDLTMSVRKAAGDIVEDRELALGDAVRDVSDESKDQDERTDARNRILKAVELLRKSVEKAVDQIDEDVLPLLKPFADELKLENPLSDTEPGPPRATECHTNMMMRIGYQMLPGIAGIKRAARCMEEAWHSVDAYSFGTSANAQQVVKTWQEALACRRTEIAECYGEAKGLYGGLTAAMWKYARNEDNGQKQIERFVSADMQRQRLGDYWHRNASRKDAFGVPPEYMEMAVTEANLDALDGGWDGKGQRPGAPPGAGPSEIAELGANTGGKIGSGLGQGLGRGGVR